MLGAKTQPSLVCLPWLPSHRRCSRQAYANQRSLQAKDRTNLLEEAKPVAPDQNRPEQTCRRQLGQFGKAERDNVSLLASLLDPAGGGRRMPYHCRS